MNSYDTYGRLLQGSSRWNGEIVVHHLEHSGTNGTQSARQAQR